MGLLDSGGKVATLQVPGAFETFPFDINDEGEIVGDYEVSGGHVGAFLYQKGTYIILNVPKAIDAWGQGINDQGVIVGYFQSTPEPISFGLALVGVLAIGVSKFRKRGEETIVRP